jgi:hypothetical protein
MKSPAKNSLIRNSFICIAALGFASCATINKPQSDVSFESLRSFHLAFVDEFAVPNKHFDAAAFDSKVNEGNAKFADAMKNEKFKARLPVLQDLANDFKADAEQIRKKAGKGKISAAFRTELKRDINDNYNNAIGKKEEGQ